MQSRRRFAPLLNAAIGALCVMFAPTPGLGVSELAPLAPLPSIAMDKVTEPSGDDEMMMLPLRREAQLALAKLQAAAVKRQ